MIQITGYQIIERVYESSNSLVYRGIEQTGARPVILKLLKQDYPNREELIRYEQEYNITRNLKMADVITAYDLIKYQNSLVIVLEDFGGQSLDIILKKCTFSIQEFLEISIKITTALEEIHNSNIIHKDINPSNIVYNQATKELKIIDFGISIVLPKEKPTLKNPNTVEGTLAYISPEQTGRTNLFLDYRSDFYSLGVTFYELLTNNKPFIKEDLLELLYCHLAVMPKSPHECCSEIPSVLSDIVIKLMDKNPDKRYQSAWGIKKDLEICLKQLKNHQKITNFKLASQDFVSRFNLSQKIYGRKQEIDTLLNIFKKIQNKESKTNAVILISGYSGIGKSALVKEIYRPITEAKGYFIEGKFDQYQKDIPYSAIIKAFEKLIDYLLFENETELQRWREKLLEILGSNAGVIIEVIPKLELIIGKVLPASILPGKESENRFNIVFQNFIKVFVSEERPLVIFLDDLHWADFASLHLIKLITTEIESNNILLIGAYRDNEVNSLPHLIPTIEEIEKTGVICEKIVLYPLKELDINSLITDSFNCSSEVANPLMELIFSKTGGNPFFVNEFLRTLYQEGIIYFDKNKRKWHWDIQLIKTKNITDNVVSLLLQKINKLNQETQNLLQIAACIGEQFDIETLAIISENTLQQTALLLREAVIAGLISPLSDAYKIIELNIQQSKDRVKVEYKFVHDRIQQAAYSLISFEQKPILHRRIGQLVLEKTRLNERDNKIFFLVYNLNLGRELINCQQEKYELAKLNLIAAKKAKGSAANETAFNYVTIAISLLDLNSWDRFYDFTLELYTEAVEASYLSGNFSTMKQLANQVLKNANNLLDKIKIYELEIEASIIQKQFSKALKTGLAILKILGINLVPNPNKLHILLEVIKIKLSLAGKNTEELANLPLMKDNYKLAAMRILSSIHPVAHLSYPNLVPLIIFKQINLSIKYGNSLLSPFAYASYGVLLYFLSLKPKNIDLAYKFGQLGLKLAFQFNSKDQIIKTTLMFYYYIIHLKNDFKQGFKSLQEAFFLGIESGNLQFAGWCGLIYATCIYYTGQNLQEISLQMKYYGQMLKKIKQKVAFDILQICHQPILNLLGQNENPCLFIGDVYNEEVMLPLYDKVYNKSELFNFYFHKLIICYIFNNYDEAIKNAMMAEQYLDGSEGILDIALFSLYDSLARLARYCSLSKSEQKLTLSKIKTNQKQLNKWALNAPMNYLNKYYLVEAEKNRVIGKKLEAIQCYDRAINLSKTNEFTQEEGIANELTAIFYLSENKANIAKVYLKQAYYCYEKWGAQAKLKVFIEQYSQFFTQPTVKTQIKVVDTTSNKITSQDIDLATIVKTALALSKETELSQLLEILLNFTVENVGAKIGKFILNKEGKQVLKAEITAQKEHQIILHNFDLKDNDLLPISLINYVQRSQEALVLNNASSEGMFIHDSYISKHQIKSILCLPLLGQGNLVGIIYLENNLTVGAFNKERLEVLKLISSQAAISIENYLLKNEKLEQINQYQVGGCLNPDSPNYITRQADFDLYQGIKAGNYCYILNARQMGKSSLRAHMIEKIEREGFCCASVDLTAIGEEDITLEQWYLGLIDELTMQFKLSEFDAEDWWVNKANFSPLQKLRKFIGEVLLVKIAGKIVIFLDELDSILRIKINIDDFFVLIRSFYNQRIDYPEYSRLTFVFLGVADPLNLTQNKNFTPFNIAYSINLSGFKLQEAQPLAKGLANKYKYPEKLLEEVLFWTGGQPFLTQKICSLIINSKDEIIVGKEAEWVEKLVNEKIIDNWEFQDQPEHLRTIQKRIVSDQSSTDLMLNLYQEILEKKEIKVNYSRITTELLLSGLVCVEQGKLKVYNRIYETIFDLLWIKQLSRTAEPINTQPGQKE